MEPVITALNLILETNGEGYELRDFYYQLFGAHPTDTECANAEKHISQLVQLVCSVRDGDMVNHFFNIERTKDVYSFTYNDFLQVEQALERLRQQYSTEIRAFYTTP